MSDDSVANPAPAMDAEAPSAISESSKQTVKKLVSLHNQIKAKSEELKELRAEYKKLNEGVREIMHQQNISTVTADGANVTLYEKKVPQSLSLDFVGDTLEAFFKERKVVTAGNPSTVAKEAAEFVFTTKKEADRGTQWTLTVRAKKEGGTVRKRKKKGDDGHGLVNAPSVAQKSKKPKIERVEL